MLLLFSRSYIDLLQRVRELFRYLPGLEGDTRSRCCSQIVICAVLVLFRSAFLYVSAVQPSLFQGQPTSFHLVFCKHPDWLIKDPDIVFMPGRCEWSEFWAVGTCRGFELSV